MECPNCHHTYSEIPIKCASCGQVYSISAVEELQNLEYLAAWLDEHQGELAAPGYRRLRQAADQHIVEARRKLAPPAVVVHPATNFPASETAPVPAFLPGQPEAAARAPLAVRPAEDVVRELLLQTRIRDELDAWVAAGAMGPATANHLRLYLAGQRQRLQAELAGRAAETPRTWQVDVIDYALHALTQWNQVGVVAQGDRVSLEAYLRNRRDELAAHKSAPAPIPARPVDQVARDYALAADTFDAVENWVKAGAISRPSADNLRRLIDADVNRLMAERAGRSAKLGPISELDIVEYAQRSMEAWTRSRAITAVEQTSLAAYLESRHKARVPPLPASPPTPQADVVTPTRVVPPVQPARTKPGPVVAAPPRPAPPPRPARPRRPPINWSKVWERAWQLVVSGALLRGLLYLGALMIVASAVVLVVRFWNNFPGLLQIGFVAAVPISFYAGGFVLRRLKIPVAGSVFTGIGALLVAVDLAAIYRLGGLAGVIDLPMYWLGSSVFCAALYLFTLYRARGEFFGYLTLIGGANVIVALAVALHLRPEWWVAAGALAGLAMVAVAGALKNRTGRWEDLARPARYFSQLVLPAAAFLAAAVTLFANPHGPWGLPATLALVAAGYAGLAWRFGFVLAEYAAVASSVFAAGFTASGLGLPFEWWGAAVAALAATYSAAGRRLDLRHLANRSGRWAWYGAAGLLAGMGLVSTLVTLNGNVWPAVSGLVLLVLLLAGWARLFRRPLFSFAAAGLFIVPFTAAVAQGLSALTLRPVAGWIAASWTVLALGYLALGAVLRPAEQHARWLYFWTHLITGLACVMLASVSLLPSLIVSNGPAAAVSLAALVGISGALAVYTASAALHHGGRHPALSRWVAWLKPADEAAFLWPIGLLLAAWLAAAWWRWAPPLRWSWFGTVLAGLGLVYVGLGQALARRRPAYRLPWHALAYALIVAGATLAAGEQLPLAVTLYLAVVTLAALAWVHRRPLETLLAAALFVVPFQLTLNLTHLPQHADALAYALLAALAYYPLGLRLRRAGGNFAWPVLGVGYVVAAGAVVIALLGPLGLLAPSLPWVGAAAPLVVLALLVASGYHLRRAPFAWAAAAVLPIAYWQALTLIGLPTAWAALAWVGLAFAGLLLERLIAARAGAGHWLRAHVRPQPVMAVAVFALALSLTAKTTLLALSGIAGQSLLPAVLAQALSVAFAIIAARLHRSRWPLYAVPALSFFAVTLFFIAYSARLFGQPLSTPQFALVWSSLALVHLIAAALLDRTTERYAHGLYAGGYALALLAVGWTLLDTMVLFWTLGLGIIAAAASAALVRTNRHHTWDEVMGTIFGPTATTTRQAARGAFLWLAGWPLPIWFVLLLQQLHVAPGLDLVGLVVSALVLLVLAVRLGRAQRTDAWPLHSAAQFYVALGLVLSAPATLAMLSTAYNFALTTNQLPVPLMVIGCALLQAVAVVFYAASARIFGRRGFAHFAAWLALVPYTLAWSIYSRISPVRLDWLTYGHLTAVQLALPWLALAVVLLAIGFALDRAKVRYAHGPYLAGYSLALFAVVWSTPDRVVQVIALGAGVVIALASQTLVHFGWQRSFDDAIAWIWRRPDRPTRRAAHIVFLFFAAYVFPLFLAQLLGYWSVPLTWRGLALALAAPLYIALGLAARRARPEYTWPLYSAGYALTALGAMVTFENEALAIYVLVLALVVYAASAVIFRQAFWLYLSNLLLPVIVLVTLHHNHLLSAPWVAGLFMGLAVAYLAAGRWLAASRTARSPGIAPMALPFLAPAYLLSAVALALAAASGERGLALAVFSAGVALYAFSAWTFRETLFIYPAAWLAAVPYYLALTLTPLPAEWLGLAWLPFILSYIVLGRFVFTKQALGPNSQRGARGALTRASTPFYLLAYALSVSMVVVSQRAAWPLSLALIAAAALYFGSAALFRRAAWLYPALLATHLALLAFLAVTPSNAPFYFASVPFMGLTWIVALTGYVMSRLRPSQLEAEPRQSIIRLGARSLDLGSLSSLQHMITPSWSQPFFLFAAVDVVAWQGLALSGLQTGQLVAAGFMILLALFAVLWRDAALRYASLGLFLLAVGYRLAAAGVALPEALAWYAGIGFGLYWVAVAASSAVERWEPTSGWAPPVAAWVTPVMRAAMAVGPVAALGSLAFVLGHTTSTALSLGFAGALYLAVAYRGRRYNLGYAAVAMLEVAWALLLSAHDFHEPQLYAIPGGLYFAGLAIFERRRGRRQFANAVEGLGLALLLVTSFIQSLNGGATGLPYFVLLIVEGLLVMWWGAARRIKIPFFAGLAAEALNVVGQVVVLFVGGETAVRWIIIGGTGLAIVAAAVVVERQRERLINRAQAWREALVTWA